MTRQERMQYDDSIPLLKISNAGNPDRVGAWEDFAATLGLTPTPTPAFPLRVLGYTLTVAEPGDANEGV